MKLVLTAASAALIALPVAAQTAPPASGQTAPAATGALTRDLNSGPPAPATYLAPAPSAAPADRPVTPAPAPTAPAPNSAPATAAPTRPVASPPPPATTRPGAPAPSAPAVSPAPASSPVATPTAAPAAAPAAEPAPATPAYVAVDAAARAALPFTLDLPATFELDAGRPGPDFTIYSVRKAGVPYVMIYAGPASQFPIYDGQMVETGGRASVVVAEGGARHAMEHLFQRATAPREIHVWVASLDPAEAAVAERIAQSIDVR